MTVAEKRMNFDLSAFENRTQQSKYARKYTNTAHALTRLQYYLYKSLIVLHMLTTSALSNSKLAHYFELRP